MRTLTLAAALTTLVAALGVAQTPRQAYKREVPPGLLRQAKISEDSALKVARARIPTGTVQALELENENGSLIWSWDFTVPNRPGTYEVHVDAKTGALVGRVEHELPRDTAHPAAPKPQA